MFKLVVLACVLAVASAGVIAPLGLAGAGWGGWAGQGLATPWTSPLASPWVSPVAIGAPVVSGTHIIHKRSAVLAAAPVAWPNAAGLTISGRLASPLTVAPLAAAPLTVGPLATAPLAATPLIGAWGRVGAWGPQW